MSRFLPDEFVAFLQGGNVSTHHDGQIPIWAGFIITQIGALMSLHDQIVADVTALGAAYEQLVNVNTSNAALAAQQAQQIADLQNQLAAGGTVTADDLTNLNKVTAQIQAAAGSTATAAAPAPVATQAPVTAQPVDPSMGSDLGANAPAPAVPVTAAPVDPSMGTDAPAPAPAAPVEPTPIPASDSGTGA